MTSPTQDAVPDTIDELIARLEAEIEKGDEALDQCRALLRERVEEHASYRERAERAEAERDSQQRVCMSVMAERDACRLAIRSLVGERDALRALLLETLRPGAYGVGSTLASRIESALASRQAAGKP